MNKDTKWLERTELLIKKDNIEKLQNTNVLIVGLGGVGSFAVEFLARSGIGKMTIVDGDVVDLSNINRQLPALQSTIGQSKAAILEQRIKDINPQIQLRSVNEFITPEKSEELISNDQYDYILDCIDSITPKLLLIKTASKLGIKIISSMGAGGKLDPSMIKYADISKTSICPFAYYVRKRLRYEGIHSGIMAVFSDETPIENSAKETDGTNFKRSYYGTCSYIPALFGLYMASWVIQDACGLFKPTKLCIPKKPKNTD
ncbi:MAG: tRNA threonylcarbamoyladenosine dehydratase [Chitinophagaceae bacterium]|nr:MAG: UBA/THIF-type NAD/FAD binding protein [Bacteroidetes bacterium OLB11]MCC6447491.1 tRNA threonylcarbamoyladenosine dehydratase [Chitinophagaceae bacterium]HMN33207.1 tRNA threonylcarbamoyladenosine dehydratase [Chitinophagaceae bacterium]